MDLFGKGSRQQRRPLIGATDVARMAWRSQETWFGNFCLLVHFPWLRQTGISYAVNTFVLQSLKARPALIFRPSWFIYICFYRCLSPATLLALCLFPNSLKRIFWIYASSILIPTWRPSVNTTCSVKPSLMPPGASLSQHIAHFSTDSLQYTTLGLVLGALVTEYLLPNSVSDTNCVALASLKVL
jgi:hypothetical protein